MKEAPDYGDNPGNKRGAPRAVVEALLLYAALPAAVMYPFGLLLLCFQIRLSYVESLSVAWSAANLIPPSTSIGLGAGAVWSLLARPDYLFTLFLLVAVVMFMSAVIARRSKKPKENLETVRAAVSTAERHVRIPMFDLVLLLPGKRALAIRTVILALLISPLIAGQVWLFFRGEWNSVLANLTLWAAGLLGGLTLVKDGFDAQSGHTSLARWFFRGAAIVFAGILLASLIESGLQKPALPRVQFNERNGGGRATEGRLLTHSEGYWYVFASEGKLEAVPDSSAGTVQFLDDNNAN